jgi:DNA-binding HxlR family transcriptional regulator
MAMALDVVGHRWSLLILRDLARTPLRFSDLQAINPSLSPSLLTQRLRSLEAAGMLERRSVRAPGKTTLYSLTEDSARPAIAPILTGLGALGAHLLEQNGPPGRVVEALAEQMRLNSHFVLARGSDLTGYFVFDLAGWLTHVVISDTEFSASADKPANLQPDATARFMLPTTMVRIMGGVESSDDAERRGLLAI